MKAVCWMGKESVEVRDLPDPRLLSRGDAIVRVTSTAICGSDLHLYNGFVPTMKEHDVLGHEFMGEVVEVGPDVRNFRVGDRVLAPFPIACGCCHFCSTGFTAACDNSNPNAGQMESAVSQAGAGIYGYSHLYGGYDGGQAEFARVPKADANLFRMPDGIPDEKLLFLTDVFPTGFQAADQAGVTLDSVVAIWGGGPVGQFAAASARLMGAGQVIVIDAIPERLELATRFSGADTLHYEKDTDGSNVVEEIKSRTGGRGADVCIDAVGMEALGHGLGAIVDHAKTWMKLETDRPNALRQAILACRKGGVVSVPGVYGGMADHIPLGPAFGKGLRFAMGQTNVHRYVPKLLDYVMRGDIDPSMIISHLVPIDRAPEMYKLFHDRDAGCTKVVLKPGMTMAEAGRGEHGAVNVF